MRLLIEMENSKKKSKKFLSWNSTIKQKDDGQWVYYPWGCPGEYFILNNAWKRRLRILEALSAFFILFLICSLVIVGEFDLLPENVLDYVVISLAYVFLAAYFSWVFIAAYFLKLSVLEQEKRHINKIFYIYIAAITLITIEFLRLNVHGLSEVWFVFLLGLYTFALLILFKLIKTKGHFISSLKGELD